MEWKANGKVQFKEIQWKEAHVINENPPEILFVEDFTSDPTEAWAAFVSKPSLRSFVIRSINSWASGTMSNVSGSGTLSQGFIPRSSAASAFAPNLRRTLAAAMLKLDAAMWRAVPLSYSTQWLSTSTPLVGLERWFYF